jgi:hypothetical protein
MDSSGAVLPGATITLSSAQGTVGSNQETTSDARGVSVHSAGHLHRQGRDQGFGPPSSGTSA